MSENANDPYGQPNALQQLDQNVLAIIRSFGEKALAGQNLGRRAVAAAMLDVYRNDFASHVDEQLRSMFAPENYSDLRLFAHTSTNILERVVAETSLLYDEPATRWLRTPEGEADDQEQATAGGRIGDLLSLSDLQLMQQQLPAGDGTSTEPTVEDEPVAAKEPTPFDAWLSAEDLDDVWSEAHRLARFNPVVWVKPEIREGDDGAPRLVYDLYTPATADVVLSPTNARQAIAWYTWRDEPKTPSIIGNVVQLFTGGAGETRRVFHLWTRDTYFQLDEKGRDVRPPEPNLVKRLPVVALRLGRPTEGYYLDGQGGDLYDATIEVCSLRSIQNRSFRDAFKQLAVSADPEKAPQGVVMGNPALPIYLGEDATASVLDFDPNLAAQSAVITEREQSIATKYGISPDAWRRSAAPTSGYAKRLDKAEVLKANRKHRKYLATAEADLYQLCALMSAQDGTSGLPGIGQLDPSLPLVVDFAEPRFDDQPLEAARAKSQRMMLGIESILDWYLEENPDLTEEEAVKQLARNRLLNERFTSKKGLSMVELLAESGSQGGGRKPSGPVGSGGGAPGATAGGA